MNDLKTAPRPHRRWALPWSHAHYLVALSLVGCAGDDGPSDGLTGPSSASTAADVASTGGTSGGGSPSDPTAEPSDSGDPSGAATDPSSSQTDDGTTGSGPSTTGEGPPPVDLCLNDADQAVLDGIDAEMVANGCAVQNVGNVDGAVECIVQETGLSMDCAACFGLTIGCVFEMCLPACFDPASDACIECRTTNCDPPFLACSGL